MGFVGSGGLRLDAVGVVAALLAAFSFAFYNIGRTRRACPLRPLESAACGSWRQQRSSGYSSIHPGKLWRPTMAASSGRFMLVFSLVSVLGPFSCYFAGLQYLEPTRAVVVSCLEPVFSIVIAAIALGELLRPLQTVGDRDCPRAIVLIQVPERAARRRLLSSPSSEPASPNSSPSSPATALPSR